MLPTKFRYIWPNGFRGEEFLTSANQKQELPMAAMFVNGSGQNEQSLERTFHRCFLPSFILFGWGVSEEKIKMWKVNRRRTPSDGKSSRCLWQGELKKLVATKYLAKFQCPRAITRPKIIGPERNVNLNCNSSLYSYTKNQVNISKHSGKKWWQLFYFGITDLGNTICPSHLSSPPVFTEVRCSIFSFLCNVL